MKFKLTSSEMVELNHASKSRSLAVVMEVWKTIAARVGCDVTTIEPRPGGEYYARKPAHDFTVTK